jgi:hypothetical protein
MIATENRLKFETTLSRELNLRLQEKTLQVEWLGRELNELRYGLLYTRAQLSAILDQFVATCLNVSREAQREEVRRALEELREKSMGLRYELPTDIEAALEVIKDDGNTEYITLGTPNVTKWNMAIDLESTVP